MLTLLLANGNSSTGRSETESFICLMRVGAIGDCFAAAGVIFAEHTSITVYWLPNIGGSFCLRESGCCLFSAGITSAVGGELTMKTAQQITTFSAYGEWNGDVGRVREAVLVV